MQQEAKFPLPGTKLSSTKPSAPIYNVGKTAAKGGIVIPNLPFIPSTVTVHLGSPSADAPNITTTFPEYIKNVASSEIYPTWPQSALTANILAQISFALNRIYTEYYRSRGYDFDITNDTSIDQSYVAGRDIFENISQTVDDLFNTYIRRRGSVEPLFAQYCDGVETTCGGLSQWGSYALAREGQDSLSILRSYYGDDIELVSNAPIREIMQSYPGTPLRLGSNSNDVKLIQTRLNRISTNYPAIPKINPVNGVFDQKTENAVRTFQQIFNLTPDGIVGNATWYRIAFLYNAVKRLNDLNTEGLRYDEISGQYPEFLSEGDNGIEVSQIQYLLALIGVYVDSIPVIAIDGIYGPETTRAVRAFQQTYDLPMTGNIDEDTYVVLYDVYLGIVDSLPDSLFENTARPYPGNPLVLGMQGEDVRNLQEYLNILARIYPSIPTITPDGIYGPATQSAVSAVQELFGLPVTGSANAVTWRTIADTYDDILAGLIVRERQYPGYDLSEEDNP